MTEQERVAVLTTNPKTIYNNYTLLKNENVLDALEVYDAHIIRGSNPTNAFVKARIKNLYRHIRQDLKRNLKADEFQQVETYINSNDFDKILYSYEDILCGFLAEIGLISTAKARDYDVQNAVDEDDAKGL
jgi:hypothetical protein